MRPCKTHRTLKDREKNRAGALACIATTRLVRVGLIVVQSAGLVSPHTAELVQSYTLYFNILPVATAGLVLMAQERVDRAVQTAG